MSGITKILVHLARKILGWLYVRRKDIQQQYDLGGTTGALQ